MLGGVARGQNLVHLCLMHMQVFHEFILGQIWRIESYFVVSDTRVHARGLG